MAIATVEDFQIGRVISRTFGVFGRNIATFLLAAALIMLPVLVVGILFGSINYFQVGMAKGWLLGAAAAAVQIICAFLLQATLVKSTISELNGARPTLGGALSTGLSLIVPIAIIAILNLLGVMLGFMLLIVPGLMLLAGWSVIVPVRVAENTGIGETFSRSWSLTKGSRWKIFGLLVMYGVVVILLSMLVGLVAGVGIASTGGHTQGNMTLTILTWIDTVLVGRSAPPASPRSITNCAPSRKAWRPSSWPRRSTETFSYLSRRRAEQQPAFQPAAQPGVIGGQELLVGHRRVSKPILVRMRSATAAMVAAILAPQHTLPECQLLDAIGVQRRLAEQQPALWSATDRRPAPAWAPPPPRCRPPGRRCAAGRG